MKNIPAPGPTLTLPTAKVSFGIMIQTILLDHGHTSGESTSLRLTGVLCM
jgi:hypothetical protein